MTTRRRRTSPFIPWSRRQFLATTSLATGALATCVFPRSARAASSDTAPGNPLMFVSPKVERFVDPLLILPLHAAGGELIARNAQHRFHRELAVSDTLALGEQSYLGPVLEAHAGTPVTQAFRNAITRHPLAEHVDPTLHGVSELDRMHPRVAMHLHGAYTEPGSDGHPLASVRLEHARTHRYANRQSAAGLWYHDHAMGITRLNVYAGLAGHYLLRDAWDTGRASNSLGLPAGEFELPLLLQDKIFHNDGTLGFRITTYVKLGSWEGGQVGDVPVVNGIAFPRHAVARGLYRLRMVNASNLRTYLLSFSNGMPFWLIGTDGGLLDRPVTLSEVRLAAGERIDILVDFARLEPGEKVQLRNTEPLPFQFLLAVGDARIDDIMRFEVGSAPGFRGAVPQTLRGGPGQPPLLPTLAAPIRTRTMTLFQLTDASRFPPARMSLNNLGFATEDVEYVVPGSVEQWDIVNCTTDDHPVHLHMAELRVLSRVPFDEQRYLRDFPTPALGTRWAPPFDAHTRGAALAAQPWEAGAKDTVHVPARHVTRMLVQWPSRETLGFDPDAAFDLPTSVAEGAPEAHAHGSAMLGSSVQPAAGRARGYVWHCHVLDHEDHDMMLPVRFRDA